MLWSIEEKIPCLPICRIFHAIQIGPHEPEAGDAELEVVGEFSEQRRLPLRRTVSHSRDNSLGAFSSLHVVHKEIFVVDQPGRFESA